MIFKLLKRSLKRLNKKKLLRINSAHKIKSLLIKTKYRIKKIIKLSKTFKNYDNLSNVTTLLGNELKYTPKHFKLYLKPYLFDIRELLHYKTTVDELHIKKNPYTMDYFSPFELFMINYMEKRLKYKGSCLELPSYKLKKKFLKKQYYSKLSLQCYYDYFELNISDNGHILPIHILKQFTHHQIFYYFNVLMTYNYNEKFMIKDTIKKINETYNKIAHIDFNKLIGIDLTTNIRLRCLIMYELAMLTDVIENKQTRLLICQLLVRNDIEKIYYDGVNSVNLWHSYSDSDSDSDSDVEDDILPSEPTTLPQIINNDIHAEGL
jgi:hypothetical protein